MQSEFKRLLHACGKGGIKCYCCRPRDSRNHKDRDWTRVVRSRLKQQDAKDRRSDD